MSRQQRLEAFERVSVWTMLTAPLPSVPETTGRRMLWSGICLSGLTPRITLLDPSAHGVESNQPTFRSTERHKQPRTTMRARISEVNAVSLIGGGS